MAITTLQDVTNSDLTQSDLNDFIASGDIDLLRSLFSATTPDLDLGSTNPADFREQAEKESSGFFDKNLDVVKNTLDTVKRQRREQKQLVESQEAETFGAFQKVQDRGFARALGRASGRFAGKGTATSGARQETLGGFFEGKEDTLEEQNRLLRQAGETREQGFSQFLESKDLQFDADKLGIDRARETETLSRQQQLATQSGTENTALQDQSNKAFTRTLGKAIGSGNFSSFLNQSLS